MPNWCENRVVITGDVKTLRAIKKAADSDGLLEHLAPIGVLPTWYSTYYRQHHNPIHL